MITRKSPSDQVADASPERPGGVRGNWDSVAEFALIRLKLNCCVYCHFVLGLKALFLSINVNRIKRNRIDLFCVCLSLVAAISGLFGVAFSIIL